MLVECTICSSCVQHEELEMYLECGSGECSACVAKDAVEDEACELIEDGCYYEGERDQSCYNLS